MNLRYAQLARPVLEHSPGRTVVALVVLFGGWFACLLGAVVLFLASGLGDRVADSPASSSIGLPELAFFLLVPVTWLPSALASCWFLRISPARVCSVAGRFRWGWFGRCLGIAAVVTAVCSAVPLLWNGAPTVTPTTDWVLVLLAALCVVPLAAFTEEFCCRGVLTHLLGARWANPVRAVAVAAVVSSVVFSFAHVPVSPVMFASYMLGGLAYAVLCDRTGGLEAASAAHAAWNVTLIATGVLFPTVVTGTSGVGGLITVVVVEVALIVTMTAVARRRGVATTTAPPRPEATVHLPAPTSTNLP